MHDSLGDRMKTQYENRTRLFLPRRTHTIIRLDGKAFHTYTRGRARPWDRDLNFHLVNAATDLCRQVQGCILGFVQSDEVSLLLADYATINTDAWYDGNIQKMASVSASILTAHFNHEEGNNVHENGTAFAYFDARAFTIADPVEVHNYFVWRQKDIERNSLSMLAQAHFPHAVLHGMKRDDLHEALHTVGVNWNDQPEAFKRGTVIVRQRNVETHETRWDFPMAAPIFTQDPLVTRLLDAYKEPQ